jgi:hypothetical protein
MSVSRVLLLLLLALSPARRSKITLAPMRVPAATRERMLRQLDALAQCRPVDEDTLHTTCMRERDGTMHHIERRPDGTIESELLITPDFDGTVKSHLLRGGSYQREERFTWAHAPEVVVLVDVHQRGWFDQKTEWTLDGSRARGHAVVSELQRDGTWTVDHAFDGDARDISTTPMPMLAAGDPSTLFTEKSLIPTAPTGYLANGLKQLLNGGAMDVDNDGVADLTLLGGPYSAQAWQLQSIRVQGFDGEGTLQLEDGAPTQLIVVGRVLLQWHRVTYSQVSADGHFEQRRMESKWPWQGQAHFRVESDPRHNGHWTLLRQGIVPEPTFHRF